MSNSLGPMVSAEGYGAGQAAQLLQGGADGVGLRSHAAADPAAARSGCVGAPGSTVGAHARDAKKGRWERR
eukprot:scaffold293764_cov30-Tisochrysis_lutea.AAC.5